MANPPLRSLSTGAVKKLIGHISGTSAGSQLMLRLLLPREDGIVPLHELSAFDSTVAQEGRDLGELKSDLDSLRKELFGVDIQMSARSLLAGQRDWSKVEEDNVAGMEKLLAGESDLAKELFLKAANNGSLEAYERLQFIREGELRNDNTDSIEILDHTWNPTGALSVGMLRYHRGDTSGAEASFLEAAQRGDVQAYKNLGFLKELERDIEAANRYYSKACTEGSLEACEKVIKLSNLNAQREVQGRLSRLWPRSKRTWPSPVPKSDFDDFKRVLEPERDSRLPAMDIFIQGLKTPTGKKLFKAATGRSLPVDFETSSIGVQAREYNLFVRRLKSVAVRGEIYDVFNKVARGEEVDGDVVIAALEKSPDGASVAARKLLQAYSNSTLRDSIKNNVRVVGGQRERNLDYDEIQELKQEFIRFIDETSESLYVSEVKEFFEKRDYALVPTLSYRGEIISRGKHVHLLPSSAWPSLFAVAAGSSLWAIWPYDPGAAVILCFMGLVCTMATTVPALEIRELRLNVDARYLD